MQNRWKTNNKSIYNVGYHLIWCPKYRRKCLIGLVQSRLKALLEEKAKEHHWIIEKMEIMPDHVHIFVKAFPVDSPHFIVQQFKGFSSRTLRSEFSELTKMPSLWSRSYYCETIGHISEETIKKYIEDQKKKK